MRLPASALLIILAATFVASAAAQTPRPTHPLQDSARLAGVWEVTPLVRADSLASDTMAVRGIEKIFWLAPGRLVYSGRRAGSSDRRVLIGLVNGSRVLLAVDGQEFSAVPGRTITIRFGQGWLAASDFAVADGAFYVTTVTGRGRSVYSTDGATWRAVMHREDTVTVRGRRISVGYASVAGMHAGRAVVGMDGEGFEGLLRIAPSAWDVLVARGDTLPGGYVVAGGWSRFILNASEYRSAPDGHWALLLRNRPTRLIGPLDGAVRMIASTDEPMPGDPSREMQYIWSMVPLEGGRFVVEVGGGKYLVGRPGAWRVVGGGRDWMRERSTIARVADATVVDSSMVLVAFNQADREFMNGRMEGRFPDLYAIEGDALRPVAWDSAVGTTIREYRRSSPGGGFELSGEISFRQIPGYSARLAVTTPYLARTPGGRNQPVELLFDPVQRRLVRMPWLRTTDGDSVSLSEIVGWNNADEAVAFRGNAIVTLRRRAQ